MTSKINIHKGMDGKPFYTVTYTDKYGNKINSTVFWNKADAIMEARLMKDLRI